TLVKFGDNTFADLTISECEGDHGSAQHCSSCEIGKHHRLPFHPVPKEKRRSKPLELVHSDLCECHVTSLGGGRYVLTFTDDCTRHCRVYILPNKFSSTVLAAFKEYQAWAERQSRQKIKELRTDRGTEYMDEMAEYVKSLGIEHNMTAGYPPQSNGVAERINRTLFDMVCPMLDSSGAPLELWSEALHTAFLYSPLSEEVYIEQPEGLELPGKENWVCKLNRALYGLKQSPRAWFSLIAPTLVNFDFQQCEADPCIFIHTNVKGETTYIAD